MSDRALSDLHPDLQVLAQKFFAQCGVEGIDAFPDQTYRCAADQNNDYARGRTAPGRIITNARYGQSPHNCTLPDGTPCARAFDFAIKDATGILDWDASDPAWRRAIEIGESLGLVSGSTWHTIKDSPHFELPNWNVDKSFPEEQPSDANV